MIYTLKLCNQILVLNNLSYIGLASGGSSGSKESLDFSKFSKEPLDFHKIFERSSFFHEIWGLLKFRNHSIQIPTEAREHLLLKELAFNYAKLCEHDVRWILF